ncbi:maltose phosphorylase [Carnobacterium iners]|uniref:Maltose phosphorylase n=2 Tax=Carnobacterium iners TaxID=1073423 RepID=A0A1X7NC05_9LACT|nr:glycoside hydrolase family 65 protein [Carnobacterium iners]SEL11386.1 maltose phosphorylase [Carnobacterium iners]SMH35134.1 maltose phosphorylase [Carnobacterium iners]
MTKRLFEVDPWKIKSSSLEIKDKRLQESLTSIGNGYMGMRGNFEEGYSGDSHLGTYVAGVWYPDKTRVGWWKNGYPEYFGKVINSTNFIPIEIALDGIKIDLAKDTVKDYSIELNMKTGILARSFIVIKEQLEVQFCFKRFVSIVVKELALINVSAKVLKGEAKVTFKPLMDGNVTNEDSNYEENFWLEIDRATGEKSHLTTQTIPNPFGIEQFTVTTMMQTLAEKADARQTNEDFMKVEEKIDYHLATGEQAMVTKLVSVVTSRDIKTDNQIAVATSILDGAIEKGPNTLEQEHVAAWAERWRKADVVIEGDDESQQGIRFNIFQLFSTYYGEDSRLNVGPKGFTGEKYGGATYWDTEAYIIPMYLSVADEAVSEQLLKYRYDQLDGAFHNARQQGLKGALYPMVTFNGVECHNEWEITFEEIHRNSSIAFAIYNYTNYTGKEDYLLTNGIDVLVGISRFWADRVHFSARENCYMIHGVTGPNEYENNVNNNWYTNKMATWTLNYTLESLGKISDDKKQALGVSDEEIAQWLEIIVKMYYPYDKELDVFVQHDTFLDKDLRPVSALSKENLPINQNWSWDKILRSCFIKQADVLQGIYYLGDTFTIEEKERNFDFYEPMTVHESSLSPSIHAILAAELGKKEIAVAFYAQTARLDLDNYNNDTEDGLHITSMSGGWLTIVQGFAGMRTAQETLSFKPFCPGNWDGYNFMIKYRSRLLHITVTKKDVTVKLSEGEALSIELYNQKIKLMDTVTVAIQ